MINNYTYRGDLDGYDIFKAICSSYRINEKPQFCDDNFNLQDLLGHKEDFVQGTTLVHSYKFEQFMVAMAIMCVLLFNLVMLYYFRKWSNQSIKRRMEQDVTQ